MTQVRCALCGEEFESPGYVYVLATSGGGLKPRPIYKSRPVCEHCGNPESQPQLERTLLRLVGIQDAERH